MASRPKPSLWRPMANAPKDGTRIFVKADNAAPWDWSKRHPVKRRAATWEPEIEIEIAHFDSSDCKYSLWCSDGYAAYPIHKPLGWQPLPPI